MNFYLIQRGKFRDIKDINEVKGLDNVIEYDYMGSAEFEFGALGKSLASIMESCLAGNFKPVLINIRGVPFLFYSESRITKASEVEELFNNPSKFRLKEYLGIEHYFEGESIERLKRNCKKKKEVVKNYSYLDFWWDIENHWFVIPVAPHYQSLINKALLSLKERGWLKKYRETHRER